MSMQERKELVDKSKKEWYPTSEDLEEGIGVGRSHWIVENGRFEKTEVRKFYYI